MRLPPRAAFTLSPSLKEEFARADAAMSASVRMRRWFRAIEQMVRADADVHRRSFEMERAARATDQLTRRRSR